MPPRPEYPLSPEEMKRRLSAMRDSYRRRAPGKVAEIEALWQMVRSVGYEHPARTELMLAAHTMVGSAPTLGCEALGAAAKTLEAVLRKTFARAQPLSESETAEIGRLVAALGESLA
jgi:HPt (histidine-containing phosphotransfer) domain-containing protein